jgi:hypothetical protein
MPEREPRAISGAEDDALISQIVHPTHSILFHRGAALKLLDANWYHKIVPEFRHWPTRESLFWMVGYLLYHHWQQVKKGRNDMLVTMETERRGIISSHPEVTALFLDDLAPAMNAKKDRGVDPAMFVQVIFSRYVAL